MKNFAYIEILYCMSWTTNACKKNIHPGIFSEMNILIIGGIGLKDFSQEWYTLFEIR